MTRFENDATPLPLPRGARRPALWAGVKRALFGINPADTSFARRAFRGDHAAVREQLESVGKSFVHGYHAALEESSPEALVARVGEVGHEWIGFAYEGAAMALTILDTITPWRRDRLQRFLAGPGEPHVYLMIVGAGWIMARLPVSPQRLLTRFDPVLRWLALDGYGFHEGFFNWPKAVERQEVPARLTGYFRRGFDQGLGRSLWFVDGADVRLLPQTIGAFPAARQGDLWAGLGLAVAYAGGRERAAVEELKRAAGTYAPQLAQGAAFAAKARERAGNLATHTELACEVLCGMSATGAAEVCDQALLNLPPDSAEVPAYDVWRQRIQERFSEGSRT